MSAPWPNAGQEQLLLACIGDDGAAASALNKLVSMRMDFAADPASAPLLPLLYRRWGLASRDLFQAGRVAYLCAWQQNRERLQHLSSVVAHLESHGISCMVLKGAAVLLAHYRDLGLRPMRDFDLMAPEASAKAAAAQLQQIGYAPEANELPDCARISHAWQFFHEDQSCDLHWRPVVRCYSPHVTSMFWERAVATSIEGVEVVVPCPTDQLFHVCVHGLQWDWQPSIRWIADAAVVIRDAPIDWERFCRLAAAANMRYRLWNAMRYLQSTFDIRIPDFVSNRLKAGVPGWERREYELLLRPCPLGMLDSWWWHVTHFRRIRPYDAQWRSIPFAAGFAQYLAMFLHAGSAREFVSKLWPLLKVRFRARVAPITSQIF